MRISTALWFSFAVFLAVLVVKIPAWDHPRTAATQTGFAPAGMLQFEPHAAAALINRRSPAALAPAAEGSRPATETYKNVKVLTDVSTAEFDRLQMAMSDWVAPKTGDGSSCAFCHTGRDFASDDNPHKVAARKMLEMTRYVNSAWKSHVEPSGVTCFTCHRGEPVPAEVWRLKTDRPQRATVARSDDWNEDAETVYGFFPTAAFAEYYLQDNPVSAEAPQALAGRGTHPEDVVVVKRVYEMMMQMSAETGLTCTSCHNSRSFKSWGQSTPQRWVGYHALRMLRDINRNHLLPLAALIPQSRRLFEENPAPVLPVRDRGFQPGNALATCGTCHYGLPKPLNGAPLLKDYPALAGSAPPSADADPNGGLTKAPLGQLQKAGLAATENQTGALR